MSQKKTLIAIAIFIVLAAIAYFAFTNTAAAPVPTATDVVSTTTTGVMGAMTPSDGGAPSSVNTSGGATVSYTDAGFSPKTINVKVGDTVKFVNNSANRMWVGADEHPTHTGYDGTSTQEHCSDGKATGGTFDQCSGGPAGTTYSFTFTKAGSFDYHNHARASDAGTVVVSQ
ncbi:MAG: hypothetical protein AB202_01695 [Parcubacteria bacterium C7867-007]|nr:MAG: hypothetical protein AB202_01695 [Parcubacteria bacterium C7867-007]